MPGFNPRTRPTSSLGVAVVGKERSIQLTPRSLSYAEVPVLDVLAAAELGGRSAPDDLALLEDVVPVGNPGERPHILVDDQNRLAARFEPFHAAPDFGANQGCQPLRRLVEDEKARVRHQRATDREHLLLAAGERGAEAPRALRAGERARTPSRPARPPRARRGWPRSPRGSLSP